MIWILALVVIVAYVIWEDSRPGTYSDRKEWYRKEYLHSKHWRKTRNKALVKANFRCEQCGSNQRLQVHHLTYKRLGNEAQGDLKVLCSNCHRYIHKKRD